MSDRAATAASLASLGRALDRVSTATGRAVSWLTLVMVLVSFLVVVLRYVFDAGFIWLQESITWMHAAVFMLGAAYTLEQDQHVRVDVFYRGLSERGKAVVDIAGVLLLLLPLMVFFLWQSWDYVETSWRIRESSGEAGGLPYPWTPLLKSCLLIMPAAVALQALALLLRSALTLYRGYGVAAVDGDSEDIRG